MANVNDIFSGMIENFNEMVQTSPDTLTDKGLLELNSVQTGDYFSGVVYVVDTYSRQNKNRQNYDLTFKMVDGNGLTFYAKMFDTQFLKIKNEIVLINSGQSNYSVKADRVFYNITRLTRYVDVKIPISRFIKEIPNISILKEECKALYDGACKDERLQPFLVKLNSEYNLLEKMSISQYKENKGVKLGTPLRMMKEMVSIYDSLYESSSKEGLDRRNLFITSIMAYLANTKATINYQIYEEAEQEKIIEDIIPISPKMMSIIYNTNMIPTHRAAILSILNNKKVFEDVGYVKGRVVVERIFFDVLRLVENKIELETLIESSTNGVLPDGTYLI